MTVIGEMRKRIELQAPVDTIDAYGQASRSWATYATVYASVVPSSGQENTIAEAMQVQQTHTITIRYRNDVLATHRALFGSRHFNFQFVRNIDERNRWLEITATERTGA